MKKTKPNNTYIEFYTIDSKGRKTFLDKIPNKKYRSKYKGGKLCQK